jgi:hypothetical protein
VIYFVIPISRTHQPVSTPFRPLHTTCVFWSANVHSGGTPPEGWNVHVVFLPAQSPDERSDYHCVELCQFTLEEALKSLSALIHNVQFRKMGLKHMGSFFLVQIGRYYGTGSTSPYTDISFIFCYLCNYISPNEFSIWQFSTRFLSFHFRKFSLWTCGASSYQPRQSAIFTTSVPLAPVIK